MDAKQQLRDALGRGDLGLAGSLCQAILTTAPDDFDALFVQAQLVEQTGVLEGALSLYDRAVLIRPDDTALLVKRGNLLRRLGRPAEALACFDRAAVFLPDHPAVHGNRGIALAELQRYADAVDAFAEVLRLRPDDIDTLANRGTMLVRAGKFAAALEDLDRALAARPALLPAIVGRATAYWRLDRHQDALTEAERAISLRADNVEAWLVRSYAAMELGLEAEALRSIDRAVALRPNDPSIVSDRGKTLLGLGRYAEALAEYDRAIDMTPTLAHPHDQRAYALRKLGRFQDALRSSEQAAALAPGDRGVRVNLALCRLLLGDFARGLPDYEARLIGKAPISDAPAWTGAEPIAGKTVLLHAEQGLGDTIQFARYAALVRERGARPILAVQPPLVPILGQIAEAVPYDQPLPAHDLHCMLLSLPLCFGTDAATIPASVPYLAASPEKASQWAAWLPKDGRKKVGLVRSGNPAHAENRARSLPSELVKTLAAPDIAFVAQQPDARPEDFPDLPILLPDIAGFADVAGLIANLDAVVSIDSAVAHLAGAMGKPLFLLLASDPDWRWHLDRTDSPWYPTARLIRQHSPGDWSEVLSALRQALT